MKKALQSPVDARQGGAHILQQRCARAAIRASSRPGRKLIRQVA